MANFTLNKSTGDFFIFSQYSEDLSRETAQSEYYRVIPSRFIAMCVDYSKLNNSQVEQYFEKFETKCNICREEINDDWTPIHSSNLFWGQLFEENGMLNVDENQYINQIRYVGDINIQSYNEYLGKGYSEIFCYMPTDLGSFKYKYNSPSSLGKEISKVVNGETIKCFPFAEHNISFEGEQELKKGYDINTIVVLYDIVSRSDNGKDTIIYKNIPMGIYFTSPINQGQMTPMYKEVSSAEVYGAGTSYGLKICTRFTPISFSDKAINVDFTISDSQVDHQLSILLSEISITQDKMQQIIDGFKTETDDIKGILSTFKNTRTNVPYIREFNGQRRWFVNGRDCGPVEINN